MSLSGRNIHVHKVMDVSLTGNRRLPQSVHDLEIADLNCDRNITGRNDGVVGRYHDRLAGVAATTVTVDLATTGWAKGV